ncbi:MAG: SDR family NAD(P)-dependent oxidoreductase [Clostridiales bacterium]|nr:SDR family NAD(P)-dependent oxidoreductase [Clostridiales bacterium]
MRIAVITGASSGMGRDFVRQLSAIEKYDEIWAIARRRERLEELKKELGDFIRPVCLDLSEKESIEEYERMLIAEKPDVAVLVNASGFGYFKQFDKAPLDGYYKMIALNDAAMVGLTYVTLPFMKENAKIYNICSVAAFQPTPYINIYSATKAFALNFTRALNVELRPRGIKALAVCPFWTRTEFFDTAVSDDTITYYQCYTESRDVVTKAIKDMKKKGRDVSICGRTAQFNAFLTKILPHKFVMRVWCGQQKKPY